MKGKKKMEKNNENHPYCLPDLENGFMVMGDKIDYRWRTTIQSVLAKDNASAYLAHHCLAEIISEDPFSHPGIYEAAIIDTWSGQYILRSNLVNDKFIYGIKVFCNKIKVEYLSFEQVIKLIEEDSFRKIYMELTYKQDGSEYRLYTPCHYINFSKKRGFIQPISGYVLYEKDDKFHMAYVVTYIKDGSCKAIQFRMRMKYFDLKGKIGKLATLFRMLEKYKKLNLNNRFFKGIDFYGLVKIKGGECRFFYYE